MLGKSVIITDRARSTRREVIVSLCLSVHTCGGGGVPQPDGTRPEYHPPARSGWGVPQPGDVHLGHPPPGQVRTGGTPVRGHPPGVPPSQVRMVEYPSQRAPTWGQDGGVPAGPPPGQVSAWSTWYAAVGMSLAFTQEDSSLCLIRYFDDSTGHSKSWENPCYEAWGIRDCRR